MRRHRLMPTPDPLRLPRLPSWAATNQPNPNRRIVRDEALDQGGGVIETSVVDEDEFTRRGESLDEVTEFRRIGRETL